MTSGSNCRSLNRPETEGLSRSIEPAYQITPPKLQHFLLGRVHQRALGSLNQVLAHEKVVIPGLHAAEGVVDGELVV